MYSHLLTSLETNLEFLKGNETLLNEVNIGLERETLRVDETTGRLSDKDHPKALGSAFAHSHITTDFAETMLEFVTDPHSSAEEALDELEKWQEFALQGMDHELFWPNSMPPTIDSKDEIKIGEYGNSNAGKMRHLYRVGLSHRYGKMMQAISGIHYNFSFKDSFLKALNKSMRPDQSLTDFKTERYLHLCRNIARFGFVIPYFIGASPIMSKTFLREQKNKFISLNDQDSYLADGTSMRLSDIGYGNNKCHFDVSYNNINDFIHNIYDAINTPCDQFSEIPVKKEGEYYQINNHILQIENEYYSSIRPKQLFPSGGNFLEALKEKGIEYVELRSVDVNPYYRVGIGLREMRFIQLLLTACFMTDADPLSQEEYEETQANIKIVAERGKEEGLMINFLGHKICMKEALTFVTDWLKPIADRLGPTFQEALDEMAEMITHSEKTPSSQLVSDIIESGLHYQEFFLQLAQKLHQESNIHLSDEELRAFQESAAASIEKQKEVEAEPQIPFDQYLKNYFDINI